MTARIGITESNLGDVEIGRKREMWSKVQEQLATHVCVPRTVGLLEQYTEGDTEKVNSFTPSFALPQGLLEEFDASILLGPQLRRDAEHRKTVLPLPLLPLRYVGGVDITYVKGTNLAVACLVIMEYPAMRVCRTIFHQCEVTEPYIPGFLAFREVVPLVELIKKIRVESCEEETPAYPQLLLVDGCGVQHPLRCGLASHVGVILDIPTIGCAKKFMAVDGMTRESMHLLFETNADDAHEAKKESLAPLVKPMIGRSGALWGYAATPNPSVRNPIFISPGHRVGYAEAAALALSMCKYRVPEPIRVADLSSRDYIRRMNLR
ncbi:endonuclease V [Trypanosoma rangeli]|uniref:Endonuclease V n=1 Tax=Trypanosoma rangeli TaxID=5698 RepID=A0A422NIX5_TRYRA|nr:endonuclease V [Trypanosoma rangeli]RNF05399.1 endonuclease V [Trypanosoma rangeli]|eukprot:RNF05399.1 endonuclease V [Trypanosoma rangeli]